MNGVDRRNSMARARTRIRALAASKGDEVKEDEDTTTAQAVEAHSQIGTIGHGSIGAILCATPSNLNRPASNGEPDDHPNRGGQRSTGALRARRRHPSASTARATTSRHAGASTATTGNAGAVERTRRCRPYARHAAPSVIEEERYGSARTEPTTSATARSAGTQSGSGPRRRSRWAAICTAVRSLRGRVGRGGFAYR